MGYAVIWVQETTLLILMPKLAKYQFKLVLDKEENSDTETVQMSVPIVKQKCLIYFVSEI